MLLHDRTSANASSSPTANHASSRIAPRSSFSDSGRTRPLGPDRSTPCRRCTVLSSPRLLLRHWREEDLGAVRRAQRRRARDGALPGHARPRRQRCAGRRQFATIFARQGFGLWAVEVPGVAPFVGFVGLCEPTLRGAPFTPCIEIGWRLAFAHWGQRLRHRGSLGRRRAMPSARSAWTRSSRSPAPANRRSRAVMERLGMTRSRADDFEHPKLPVGHPLAAARALSAEAAECRRYGRLPRPELLPTSGRNRCSRSRANWSRNSRGLSPNLALNERDSTDGEENPVAVAISWIGMSP